MRIGIDTRFYSSSFTGIGRYVFELVHRILSIDNKNEYFLFFNDPHFEEFTTTRKNVKKIRVNAAHYSFDEQWKFWRLLEKENLDLMHFTHFNAPILYRKPSVVTIHDLTLSFYPGKKMTSPIYRFAYNLTLRSIVNRAVHIISASKNTKQDLVNLLNVDSNKISVVYEGASDIFRQITDKKTIQTFMNKFSLADKYLLYTGVWRSHKNLLGLIQSFKILKEKYKFAGQLAITGKEDPLYPEVRETVAQAGLKHDVKFLGFLSEEDLVLAYNGALAYVLPSFYEGFGLPILEAFKCGTPVCASNTSCIPEICGEGNAILFDPKSPEDIAQKIAALINNPTKIAELRYRGFTREKEFSFERMANETLSIYNSFDVHSHSTNPS